MNPVGLIIRIYHGAMSPERPKKKVTYSPMRRNVDFFNVKPADIRRMFLLSPHPTRRLNRIVSLHPPVYPVTAAVLRAMITESPFFVTSAYQKIYELTEMFMFRN